MLPVTGLTLPFLSFGGTSLLVSMTAAGLLLAAREQPVRVTGPPAGGAGERARGRGAQRAFAVITGGGTAGHVLPALAVAEALVDRGHDLDDIHYVGARAGHRDPAGPADRPAPHVPRRGRHPAPPRPQQPGLRAQAAPRRPTTRPRCCGTGGPASSCRSAATPACPRCWRPAGCGSRSSTSSYDRRPGRACQLGGPVRRGVGGVVPRLGAAPGPADRRAAAPGRPGRGPGPGPGRGRGRRSACRRTGSSSSWSAARSAPACSTTWSGLRGGPAGAATWPCATWSGSGSSTGPPRRGPAEAASCTPWSATRSACRRPTRRPISSSPRAGASTIAELAAIGVPSILVPWPGAAEDHQTDNARSLAADGAAVLLPESELSPARLAVRSTVRADREPAAMAAAARAAGELHHSGRLAPLIEEVAAGGERGPSERARRPGPRLRSTSRSRAATTWSAWVGRA